jgi:hypothetical protein
MGETIPYITATTAGYLAGGPAGGFAVGSMVEGNSAYRTALEYGVPDSKARGIGAGVGIVAGAIEAYGGRYAEQLLLRATSKLRTKAAKSGAVLTIGTVVEALEEGAQEVAQVTGEEIYRDVDWNEAASRTLSSMAAGAFLGGTFKAVGSAGRAALGPSGKPLIDEAIKEGPQPPVVAPVVDATPPVDPQRRADDLRRVKNILTQDEFAQLSDDAKFEEAKKMLRPDGIVPTREEILGETAAQPDAAISQAQSAIEAVGKLPRGASPSRGRTSRSGQA